MPSWPYWVCLIVGAVSAYFIILHATQSMLPRAAVVLAAAVLLGILTEGAAALLLHDALASADKRKARLFEHLFSARNGTGVTTGEGDIPNFAPHPYLGFALNPHASYGGIRQYNADYLIRRGEPIRQRAEVDLRVLVLGGSTSFGAGVSREQDTWIKVLEGRLRARISPRTDVINGGVSGYNIVENMFHYLLLLQKLEPDLVLLITGVNDVDPRLIGELRPDYSNSRMVWNGEALAHIRPSAFLSWSRLYRLLIWHRIDAGELGHIYTIVQHPYPDVGTWRDQLKRNGSAEYERYLRTFARLLRADGRRVVIVPQPWQAQPGHLGDEYFGIGVREHNTVSARVAAEMGVPFVKEAADAAVFRPQLFWDALHFNEEGSIVMARLMADWLCARPDVVRRACAEPATP